MINIYTHTHTLLNGMYFLPLDLTTPKNVKKPTKHTKTRSGEINEQHVATTPRSTAVFQETGAARLEFTEGSHTPQSAQSSSELAAENVVPKHLRFAEPAEEGEDTPPATPLKVDPACLTPPSPSSPRSLRDRSPTPER